MKRFLIELGKATSLYLLVVVGGTVLLLIASSFIGYFPYSDRPGPGWFGWRGTITLREILYFLSWSILALIPGAIAGALLSVTVQLLQWIHTPRWLIATFGGFASGLLSFYLISGAGWYIAIAAFPVYGAAVLGCVFGSWLLPRQTVSAGTSAPLGIKPRLVIFAIWFVATAWIISPFITRSSCENDQNLEVMFVEWRPGRDPLSFLGDGLTPVEMNQLSGTGLTGQLTRKGFTRQSWEGVTGEKQARIVIVMQRPLDAAVDLPQPDATSVIYVQETKDWKMIPSDVTTLRRTIRLASAKTDPRKIHFEARQGCGRASGETVFDWTTPSNGPSG